MSKPSDEFVGNLILVLMAAVLMSTAARPTAAAPLTLH